MLLAHPVNSIGNGEEGPITGVRQVVKLRENLRDWLLQGDLRSCSSSQAMTGILNSQIF